MATLVHRQSSRLQPKPCRLQQTQTTQFPNRQSPTPNHTPNRPPDPSNSTPIQLGPGQFLIGSNPFVARILSGPTGIRPNATRSSNPVQLYPNQAYVNRHHFQCLNHTEMANTGTLKATVRTQLHTAINVYNVWSVICGT